MKKLGLLLTILLLASSMQAKQMKDVFLSMPDSITPLLSSINKADFIDFLESDMKAEVKNVLGGTSQMKTLTSDYCLIQMSENSSWEFKILPYEQDYIVGIIRTVNGPAAGSALSFYNSNWEPLKTSEFISEPVLLDYLKVEEFDASTSKEKSVDLSAVDISLIRYDFSSDSLNLSAKLTTPEYLDKESREKIVPLFNLILTYRWAQNRFELD